MRTKLLIFTVVLAMLISACAPVQPVAAPEAEAPEAEAPEAATEQGIVVNDAIGQGVVFDEAPQKIVIAGRGVYMLTSALFMFDEAKDRLAAFEGGRYNDPANFIPLVDDTFGDKIVLERNAGPEQIAPVGPDVVLLKTNAEEGLGDSISAVGMPIVYLEMESTDQYFNDLRTLGQLFDNSARAEEIIAYFQERLDRVTDAVGDVDESEKPTVLLFQYDEEGDTVAVEVPPAAWLQTNQVELAGGLPVWKEAAPGGGWTAVNFEQIAQWNPDKIFVVTYQSDAKEVVDKLKETPEWQALDAVQNDEIYAYPEEIFGWDSPDPRWILGVTWLATKINPEAMGDVEMMEEIHSFFSEMYGMDAETIDAEIISKLTGDIE